MLRENVEFVRKPLRVRARSRRSLEQRLAIRFPRLGAALARLLIGRLPPGSRVRQAFMWRVVRLGIEAFNRRDLDAVVLGFQPDVAYYPYREFAEAGLAEPCYHGPSGYRAYVSSTYEAWGNDVLIEPTELILFGDRFVLLADMPMRARASGVSLAQTYACVATLRDGRVSHQRDYLDHADALAAVGLSDQRGEFRGP
jgi:ketosteroid isomerase-like protein